MSEMKQDRDWSLEHFTKQPVSLPTHTRNAEVVDLKRCIHCHNTDGDLKTITVEFDQVQVLMASICAKCVASIRISFEGAPWTGNEA